MSFKCCIGNAALRCWGRAIHTLVSAGENDIHFRITPTSLTMTSIDSSLTVVCQCQFEKAFFYRYELIDTSEITCRMPSKCILKPFKSLRFLVRCTDACEMEFDTERSAMKLTIPYKGGVKVRHKLQFSVEEDPIDLDIDPDLLINCIAAEPKLMLQSLSNFAVSKGVSDLTLKMSNNKVLMKNCANDMIKKEGKVYTELLLNSIDFRQYTIKGDCELTFQMREFKSFISFAEQMRASLTMHFKGPKEPFMVKAQNEDGLYIATLVLATSSTGAERIARPSTRQPSSSSAYLNSTSTPVRSVAKRPRDDQQSASTLKHQSYGPIVAENTGENARAVMQENMRPSTMPVSQPSTASMNQPKPVNEIVLDFDENNGEDLNAATVDQDLMLDAPDAFMDMEDDEGPKSPILKCIAFRKSKSNSCTSRNASQSMLLDDSVPVVDLENDENVLQAPSGSADIERRRKRVKLLFPNAGKVFDPARDIPGFTDILCEGTDEEDN